MLVVIRHFVLENLLMNKEMILELKFFFVIYGQHEITTAYLCYSIKV